MAYHDEIVEVEDEHGDKERVYRYLRCCKHCVSWTGGDAERGECSLLKIMTHHRRTTCESFIATEVGITTMWMETASRKGEFCRIIYNGVAHYVEKKDLVSMLGYDPDEDYRSAATART